ncbi:RNA-directed DNA polymerase (Reverse transcriptase) [Methylocella silvestris BL2]|uniref:RNA-directed DNA polymerase (Reverse transcriptase) n=1 Tax=Methylocella silvestris (strain DSM 15510 / CIP 108128 / LMG 27833 / NCIMB 13906 / BL2) TaxID=395965 RepID=B8ERN1_METSB|nr:reverse transcriptase domain-containing protein [Methylocella silvestris]ACK51083.1 RNA-directed DNA polymerase (Reverse transcriptase) [Methylocella silvestris BL2]
MDFAKQVRIAKTLNKAWKAVQRNSQTSKSIETRREVEAFEANSQSNLKRIADQLLHRKFIFPAAKGVPIQKAKGKRGDIRPLVVAKVEARIVQRAIHDVLIEVPSIRRYVRTPYSFGGVRKEKDDSVSAVPAAIDAAMAAIGDGFSYYIRSDITAFFTKIPKSAVAALVSDAVGHQSEFMDLFRRAIHVELENMARLARTVNAFPIYDIGVAQGNSLSPLLGNILLYDFDQQMNGNPDAVCLRYIDDFIIFAKTQQLAENMFQKAIHILASHGMSVAKHKTVKGLVRDKFEFLGIEFANGLLRPCSASRHRMILSIDKILISSRDALRGFKKTGELNRQCSFLHTLLKVSGIVQGWGAHYWFCKDRSCFDEMDKRIGTMISRYFGVVRDEREGCTNLQKWQMLGLTPLSNMQRRPFVWPKKGEKYISSVNPPPPAIPIPITR